MDYANGKIYKIVCNITGEVYIGSTTTALSKRLSIHKSKKNCSSKQIIDRGDYVIVLIEAIPCENKSELFKRERYHYDLIPNINRNRPFITDEESIELNRERVKAYEEANREVISTRQKARYENNREALLTQQKAYYEDNKEAVLAKKKARYEAQKTAPNQPS